MTESKTWLAKLLALAAGIEYVTVVSRFPILGITSFSALIALSVLVLGPLTVALVICAGKASWLIVPLLVFIGVISGIMIDVVSDTKVDRNLFPIEIILLSVVVAPILVASSALGWFLKNRISLKDPLAQYSRRSPP